MGLFQLLMVLLVIGIILYIINRPDVLIDGKIKKIINWVVIVVVLIWLLRILFASTGIHDIKI